MMTVTKEGFPGGSDDTESPCVARDPGVIPGLGRTPGEENGKPLQYSCLENPMKRGAHGVAKSRTQLSTYCHIPKMDNQKQEINS